MTEPLSLDEVKANLRVDSSSEDARLTTLIVAARAYIEDWTGLVLVPRDVTETAPMLGAAITLSSWPVVSISAIRYPSAGVMTALADGSWLVSLKRRPVRLLPATRGWGIGAWSLCQVPTLPVEIDIQAGFATPDDVPEAVKQAMHLLVAHWYLNRSAAEVGARAAAIEIPHGVEPLLRAWRLKRI